MQTKTIFPAFLILGLWFISLSMNFPSFQVEVLPGNSATSFALQIENPEKKKLNITISHQYSGIAADTMISSDRFYQRYNLNEAEDGQYTIRVGSGKDVVIKKIELNTVTSKLMKILQ